VQKAFDLKEKFTTTATGGDRLVYEHLAFRRTDEAGTHVCLYTYAGEGTFTPIECRYMPDVPIAPFEIDEYGKIANKQISAYPLKKEADCTNAKDAIAGKDDEVVKVILCAE
jgi:hypothetical protein